MREITKHIIHCTDTNNGKHYSVADIRKWHMEENGWSDCGYHFIVYVDGTIAVGRPMEKQGAHCYGYNRESIGTALVGRDEFSDIQLEALKTLHNTLNNIYLGIEPYGHRDFTDRKTCPNIEVREILTK
jgi:N-acetylmuramoyl-L-alanine amidase